MKEVLLILIVINILLYMGIKLSVCITYFYTVLYVNYILIKLGKTIYAQGKKEFSAFVHNKIKVSGLYYS